MPSVSLPSGKGSENSCTVHTLTAAARRNTSLREGGGLGRSPKTEGASGQETNLTTGGGTSPGLKFSHAPSQESAGFNRHRVSAVMSRCQPISKPSAYSPLAPSVTAKATGGSPAVPAPSRRELWGLYLATLVCCSGGSASCESLRQKSEIFASSLSQGSLFAFGIVTERKGERKQLHHALTAEARRPRPVSAACPPNLLPIPSSLFPKKHGIVTLQRASFIPPSGREVAWGAAPRRREPAGRKPI